MSQEWVKKWINSQGGRLLRYVMKILKNEQLAQEVVQETFLRLLQMKREEVEDKLPEWLFKVCRNRAIDIIRKKRPTTSLDIETAEMADNSSPLNSMEENEGVRKMIDQINHLPEAHQEVVRLKFQEGMSYQQISEVTGLTTTNIGFILSNSLKKIREGMTDYLTEGKGE